MTYEEQIGAIDSIGYFHQKEMGEAAPHVRASLRVLQQLKKAGVPVDQKEAFEQWLKTYQAANAPQQKEQYAQYQEFVGLYFKFCKSFINVEPVMDGKQGKAMRSIISYLIKNCKAKNEEGALLAWQFILKNWEKLTPYIRNQSTLAQMYKNIQEILTQLRNGNTKQDAGRRASSSIRERAKRRRS